MKGSNALQPGDVLAFRGQSKLARLWWLNGDPRDWLALVCLVLAIWIACCLQARGAESAGDFGFPDGTVMWNGPIAFAHDALSGNPAWTMHVVTAKSLNSDAGRCDTFSPDRRIPTAWRATNADYAKSGWQRGHLAPEADLFSRADRVASCSLSNIGPQHPDCNEFYWGKRIETAVRSLATGEVVLYVGTTLIYDDAKGGKLAVRTIGEHNLWVPRYFAKTVLVVWSGKPQGMRAWIVENEAIDHDTTEEMRRTSVAEVQRRARKDFYPLLEDTIEEAMEAAGPREF